MYINMLLKSVWFLVRPFLVYNRVTISGIMLYASVKVNPDLPPTPPLQQIEKIPHLLRQQKIYSFQIFHRKRMFCSIFQYFIFL